MKKKVVLILLLGLLTVVGVAIWGARTKVKGVIKKEERVVATEVVPETNIYEGKFFSLVYEDKYELRENDDGVELLGKSGNSSHIVITVKTTKEISVEEISAIKMRQLNPKKYLKSSVDFLGEKAVEFSGRESFEKVVVSIRDKKLITLAMTANSNDDGLENDFKNLLVGFTWK